MASNTGGGKPPFPTCKLINVKGLLQILCRTKCSLGKKPGDPGVSLRSTSGFKLSLVRRLEEKNARQKKRDCRILIQQSHIGNQQCYRAYGVEPPTTTLFARNVVEVARCKLERALL